MFDNILQKEHPEKNGWWINELESFGIDTKCNVNELVDKQVIVIWSRLSRRNLLSTRILTHLHFLED